MSNILHDLRLSSASYGINEFVAPWGVDIPPEPGARFHFVARGHCWLRRVGRAPVLLACGDMVLLPDGRGHTIGDSPDGPTRPLHEVPFERLSERVVALRCDGVGGETSSLIVCCTVMFDGPLVHPLLDLMPDVLVVRNGDLRDPALPALLDTMAEEVLAARVGAAAVTTRLADVVIVRVVRAWLEENAGDVRGWLAALRDEHVGRALAAIHHRPDAAWTVGTLAHAAGLSRSRFAERFTEVIGLPPARYVERWRLQLASAALRDRRTSVTEVAARVGYASEVSFRRAFKRVLGVAPTAARRADEARTP